MELKKCGECGEDKPLREFHKDKSRPSGLAYNCKECRKEFSSKYYLNNKKKLDAANKEYNRKNKKKLYKYKKEWYQKNKESARTAGAQWRQNNKEYHATYMRERRRNDPVFRIKGSMGAGMWACLKGLHKNSRTFSYIDKSPEELMNYLEKQFTEGMSRENYGEWHVDHIRPLASFEFDKYKEGSAEFEALLGEAWHYTNLQPLWAADNISKGAKWGPAEKD
jgi:hypothetical protein